MRPATRPLVVFADQGVCDTRHGHHVGVVTDGLTAYANGDWTDCPPARREDKDLIVTCGQPVDGEPCDGEIVFDLTREGTWTANPTSVSLLVEYGEKVTR